MSSQQRQRNVSDVLELSCPARCRFSKAHIPDGWSPRPLPARTASGQEVDLTSGHGEGAFYCACQSDAFLDAGGSAIVYASEGCNIASTLVVRRRRDLCHVVWLHLRSDWYRLDSWEAKMTKTCEAQFSVAPRKGDAIVFYSQHPDGSGKLEDPWHLS